MFLTLCLNLDDHLKALHIVTHTHRLTQTRWWSSLSTQTLLNEVTRYEYLFVADLQLDKIKDPSEVPRSLDFIGAGDGNRTHAISLEGWKIAYFYIVHNPHSSCYIKVFCLLSCNV